MLGVLVLPMGLISGLIYLSGGENIGLIIAGVACAIAAIIAPELGFYGYLAWQALDPTFVTERSTVLTPSKVLALCLLANYVLGVWRRKTPMLVSKRFVWTMLAFGGFGLLYFPIAVDRQVTVRFAGQIIVQVLLVVAAIHTLRTRLTISRALFFTVLGGVVASGVMLIGGGKSGAFQRSTLAEFANPNSTALALAVSLMTVPAAWALHRNKLARLFYLLAAPIILAATMQTGSRAILVAIVIAVGFGGFLAHGSGKVKRLLIPAICLAVLLGTAAYLFSAAVLNPVSQERIEAFVQRQGSMRGESRLYIWELVLRTYLHRPWGFGFGNTQFYLVQEHGLQFGAHSSYISALVDGGPIGFGLFIFGLVELLRRVIGIRQANPGIPAAMMFCFIGLSALTHTVHFTKWFWIPVTICLLLAEQTQRERLQQRAAIDPSGGY